MQQYECNRCDLGEPCVALVPDGTEAPGYCLTDTTDAGWKLTGKDVPVPKLPDSARTLVHVRDALQYVLDALRKRAEGESWS